MKPTREEISKAVWQMAEIIPFFPESAVGREIVCSAIASFVAAKEQLDWLTVTACNVMQRFSLPELRGIYCSRYAPADGVWTAAETPGYTPAEAMETAEQEFLAAEARETDRKLEQWRQEFRLLGEAPDPAPLAKLLPPAGEKPSLRLIRRGDAPESPETRKERLLEAERNLRETLANTKRRSDSETRRLIAGLEESLKKRQV